MLRRLIFVFLLTSTYAGAPAAPVGPAARFNVKDHGAKADGATDDSAAINQAIEGAKKAGPGSSVLIPA